MGWSREKTDSKFERLRELLRKEPNLTKKQLEVRGFNLGMIRKAKKEIRTKEKCPHCNGNGGEYKAAGFCGQRWFECKKCKGTGKRRRKK